MPKFLVTYHGGGMPASEEGRQQAMAAFAAQKPDVTAGSRDKAKH